MRKKITAANMTLTPDEAAKFWPIYDQYIKETMKINDERWATIKNYATNYNTMTNQVAQDYMEHSANADQQLIALLAKYISIFQNAISPKKTAQWYQIDRRVDTMINLQLASLIPIVKVDK